MFARPNSETACGMFTLPHILSLIACLMLVGLALYLSRKFDERKIKLTTKIMAYVFTVWEIAKIIFKFAIDDAKYLDHWVPLYFCSLFICALWMCAYGGGRIYKLGESFVIGGCIIGGFAFLVVPATSLMDYPVYHFLSIHSMLFHSSMLYMGILYIWRLKLRLDLSAFKNYSIFVGFFGAVSIILNLMLDQNFMILTRPVNIPIEFLNVIANNVPWLYTIGVLILYIVIPFFTVKGILFIIKKQTLVRWFYEMSILWLSRKQGY